jgi:GTP pyrophosphokinase
MTKIKELKEKSELINRAYRFAEKAHSGQKRRNGEPYFNHVLATAETLAEWGLDEKTVAASLLHDVVEDTSLELEDVKKEFGDDIAFLVEGVTKLGKVKYRGVESQIENLRKLILSMAADLRILLIKLADRLHNMKTLSALPPQKQKRIALETMEIYAPLAYRLGMQRLSGELEDLAFPYVYPREYRWLIENVKGRYEERERYLEKIKPIVLQALHQHNVQLLAFDFRAKRYASLYKKLLKYEMNLDKIYDLVAFRLIVKTVEDCYAALGVIHNLWPPLPGRIKDYIAMPKANGYRSLHTTVFSIDQTPVEFQIRTQEMHDEAENGIAAHWAYEESKNTKDYLKRQPPRAPGQETALVEQLRAWQKQFPESANSREFIDAFKIDFLKDRIFAITPKGEVIDLPQGATPIDFAYHIHSDIGNQCVGAKVNGKIVPLDYRLQSSDVVEIVTQKNKKPSASWLEFVVTATARHNIKSALKGKLGTGLLEKPRKQTEFKIVAADRIGLIKDISSIIARSHINIVSVDSSARRQGKFHLIKIKCDTNDKNKVWKLILKIKALKEVKEIDYRFV